MIDTCSRCGSEDDLIDGMCADCWDWYRRLINRNLKSKKMIRDV